MKPAIAYGLKGSWRGHSVIEITSQNRCYYYGREANGSQTRGRLNDLIVQFDTREKAYACSLSIFRATNDTQAAITDARKLLHSAEVRQRDAIEEAVRKHKETD